MHINKAFGLALKKSRKDKKKTQEDFGIVSSRTYVSSLERGLKSITIEKLEEIATVLGVHPMTLLYRTYRMKDGRKSAEKIVEILKSEFESEKSASHKE